jgi:regulator of replication initiation timing
MEIAQKIKKRKEALERLAALDNVVKETKQEIAGLESEIMEDATNNMVTELVVDNEKYKFKYENKIYIKELVSDHSKKVELIKRLAELGYTEGILFESGYYPAPALKKIWNELSVDTINQFAADDLIYHETKPSITSRKVKK